MHQHPTGYMPYEKYLQMNFNAHEVHLDEGGPALKSFLKYTGKYKVQAVL